jgi:hypothetical protein
MIQLLEQTFAEIQKLTDLEQDAIAAIMLDELADERRWETSFIGSRVQAPRTIVICPTLSATNRRGKLES